jgi:16S rRNA (uracil1498-N3)-methyltransferase
VSAAWFYLEAIPEVGERGALDEEEGRHASSARRLREGDALVVFDGAGGWAEAQIETLAKKRITLEIVARHQQPARAPALHLACALPKGDRAATLLGMATQLGVQSITPLSCERSIVKPSDSSHARWARILREACKQSRRARLPIINATRAPLTVAAEAPSDMRCLLLDPDGQAASEWLAEQPPDSSAPVSLFVGPEGGFTETECQGLLERGARAICVSNGILRVETAAIAGLAIVGLLNAATSALPDD